MTLTRKWQVRDAWPDYSQLPLPIGAELEQHEAIPAAGGAAAGQGPPAAEPSSPWHSTLNLGDWADDPWAIEQARLAAAAAERQRYEAAVAAQRAAAMAHAQHAAQHAAQQQRVQSTAAAAEADDFDMSLFKEATGARLCWLAPSLPPFGLGALDGSPGSLVAACLAQASHTRALLCSGAQLLPPPTCRRRCAGRAVGAGGSAARPAATPGGDALGRHCPAAAARPAAAPRLVRFCATASGQLGGSASLCALRPLVHS